MSPRRVRARLGLLALATLAVAGGAVGVARAVGWDDPLPRSELALRTGGGESPPWWRSSSAPASWSGALPEVAAAVRWHDTAGAVAWGELALRGTGEARRTGVVLVLVDPRRVSLRLDLPTTDPAAAGGWLGSSRWSIAAAPAQALLALNAGQFTAAGAWGWLVRDGRELQPPQPGPLAPAVVVDATGRLHVVPAARIDSVRRAPGVVLAFQSYPALLQGGRVPAPLQRGGRGVDVAHRDARLAIGTRPDGRILIALTRFEGLGGALDLLPLGLTTPEMAALMGALGCRDAVLLDGGVSGQLLLRDPAGVAYQWPGMRRVPLGLLAESR